MFPPYFGHTSASRFRSEKSCRSATLAQQGRHEHTRQGRRKNTRQAKGALAPGHPGALAPAPAPASAWRRRAPLTQLASSGSSRRLRNRLRHKWLFGVGFVRLLRPPRASPLHHATFVARRVMTVGERACLTLHASLADRRRVPAALYRSRKPSSAQPRRCRPHRRPVPPRPLLTHVRVTVSCVNVLRAFPF